MDELMVQLRKIENIFQKNPVRIYLIIANIVLVIFAIWFSNVGLLPFRNVGDFVFFIILTMILAIYRPGWTFVLFIGSIALENVNLAPSKFGLTLRPYQLFGAMTLVSVGLQFLIKRKSVQFPKLKWIDLLPILFAVGSLFGSMVSVSKVGSLKQAAIAITFVALYFLVRIYIQSWDDFKKVTPFFLSSSVIVCLYAIWQNIRFGHGIVSFQVMPGRPNGTFTEPDWLGIYLVLLLSVILTFIYSQSKKTTIFNFQPALSADRFPTRLAEDGESRRVFKQFSISQILNYSYLLLIFVVLILTVSRSAWIGALVVLLGYFKITLFYGGEVEDFRSKEKNFFLEFFGLLKRCWHWKKFFQEIIKMLLIFIAAIGIISVFNLTSFQLGNRAQSTAGLQKITVACQAGSVAPSQISNISQLSGYGCKHINLEDIENEKNAGNSIQEIFRLDPNVGIRAKIYGISLEQIKIHPIFGIGWGSISNILGKDERGAGLNASNIFLETWLGSGILGISSLLMIIGYIAISSIVKLVMWHNNIIMPVFLILGIFAIIVPNLFNSGIFLGFVWVFFAVSVGLLNEDKK